MNKIKQASDWLVGEIPITRAVIVYLLIAIVADWFPNNTVVKAVAFYIQMVVMGLFLYGIFRDRDNQKRRYTAHQIWVLTGAFLLGAVAALIVHNLIS